MGSCTRRHFMLSTCLLQMITIIERQVFDFLGYMWAPILVNFFHIIFIILGFYGAYHFRIKYIITYLIWSFIWIGWNAFLICFYLNVGILDRDSDLLNLGTGSVSWFEVNGYGCKPTYPVNITSDDPFRPIRPERVDDCLLDYTIVEIVQSGVQCALALLGILGAILISYIFLDEDDRFDFVNGDAKSPQHTVVHPMYVSYSSIPTSASASATLLSNKHHQTNTNHQALNNNNHNHQLQIHAQQQLQQQQQQQFNHQQPNNFNSNTFLIHTNSISNNSHSHSHNHSQNQSQSHSHSTSRSRSHSRSNSQSGGGGIASRKGRGGGDGNSNYPSASKNSTLTRILYSPKSSNKIGASTGNTIVVATELLQRQQSLPQTHTANLHGAQHYYDDSTAKADQLYTNSNRRQFLNGTTYQQQQQVGTPNSSTHDNTTSSLSYASLQNSNLNLTQSLRGGGGGSGPGVGFGYTGGGTGGGSVGGSRSGGGGVGHMGGGGMIMGGGGSVGGYGRVVGGVMTTASSQATLSPLSNSQFSLSNSLNNNYSNHSGNNNNMNNNNNIVLSNPTNYMTNNNNNNGSMGSGIGGGHFARIHAKPKPPKSTSYSSFINNGSGPASLNGSSVGTGGSMTNVHRPDIKYTQMSNERLSRNLEEGLEEDNFSLQNFKTDDGVTYVPFQKPTPGAALFVGQNNNPSYVSLNSYAGAQLSPNNNNNNNASPNVINNNALPQFARSISQMAPPPPLPEHSVGGGGEILLERGAVLQPAYNYQQPQQAQQGMMHSPGPPTHIQPQLQQPVQGVSGAQSQHSPQPLLNPANRFLYQQNGLPFHPAYNKPIPVPLPVPTHSSPPMSAPYQSHLMSPVAKQPPRPTNIPLPTIPAHSFDSPISPSEVTPPPPPAPRPHIFQPRSGHAPYPDLSPEVTEKYAMPTQYVPRSPVASRIARRQRQQQQQQSHNHHHHQQAAQPATHHMNTSANFCDQVRDAPPGYIVDAGFSIVRAKSYDRLASASSNAGSMRRETKAAADASQSQQQQAQVNAEAAPHVNRRSGRRDAAGRVRPRSYCNSMSGGEGVIRGSLVYERDFAVQSGVVGNNGVDGGGVGINGGSGVVEGGGNVGGDQLA